jgi:hypothetical protein
MTEPENLILRYLRGVDEKIDRLDARQQDMAADLRSVKAHMAAFLQAEAAQDSSIASILVRLEKIERPLELNN